MKIEDSELMRSLNDYDIIPSDRIKRKLDYFYLPYNPIINTQKYMNFKNVEVDEDQDKFLNKKKQRKQTKIVLEPKIYAQRNQLYKISASQPNDTQNELSAQQRKLGMQLWGQFKDKIFETEKPIIHQINRQLKMSEPSDDFLTKLDLIDTHPELFL